MQWYAFDLKTGQKVWGPSKAFTDPFGMFDFQGGGKYVVNGILYSGGYDGTIHAYDVSSGQELWDFFDGNAGTLTPYGTWPFYNGFTVADGKLFATTGDHGNGVQTLFAGEGLYVIDAVTGKSVWNVTGWFEQPAIADGILISHNNYDNLLYAFGKGPSATTITVPLTAITLGSNMVIQGQVTDQSPAAKQLVESGKFSIVPAVSDADQGAYMAYLYEQQVKPTNAKGVKVHITALDPNGNFQDIGNVTTDLAGLYHVTWTPPVPGEYVISATFEGSSSYSASSAEAATVVGSAQVTPVVTPTPSQTTVPTSSPAQTVSPSPSVAPQPTGGIPITTYVAIAAAVVIIAVIAAAFVLRRRK